MADLNKPSVDSDYTEFPTELRAAIFAALSFMQGEHTNIPAGSKRWNPNSKIFETYASGQWRPMATSYHLPVEYSSLLHKPSPKTQVNSNSETDFASLKAVKIAYDKAVEASTMGGGIDESQVSNSVSSNSSATVASSKAVKIAYDRANTAYNLANEKVGNDRISSSVSSTSTTTVANSRAVKVAYDKAVSAYNRAYHHQHNISDINGLDDRLVRGIKLVKGEEGYYENNGLIINWCNVYKKYISHKYYFRREGFTKVRYTETIYEYYYTYKKPFTTQILFIYTENMGVINKSSLASYKKREEVIISGSNNYTSGTHKVGTIFAIGY